MGTPGNDPDGSPRRAGRVTAVDSRQQRIAVAHTARAGATLSTRSRQHGSHPMGAAVGLRYRPATGRIAFDGGFPPVAGPAIGGALLPAAAIGFAVSLLARHQPDRPRWRVLAGLARNRSRATSSSG